MNYETLILLILKLSMMKKIGLLLLLLSCGATLYFSYETLKKKTALQAPIITSIPKDAAIIIKLKKPFETFYNLSETNLVWKGLSTIPSINTLNKNIKNIDSTLKSIKLLQKKPLTISFHPGVEEINSFFAFTNNEKDFKYIEKELQLEKNELHKEQQLFHSNHINGIFICYVKPFTLVSTNKNLLQKSINQLFDKQNLLYDSSFNFLYSKSKTSKQDQVYIGIKNLKKIATKYLTKNALEKWNDNKNWISLDIILENNQLLLNGIADYKTKNVTKLKSSQRIDTQLLPKNLQTIEELTYDNEDLPEVYTNTINNECDCKSKQILSSLLNNHISIIKFGKEGNEKAIYIALKPASDFSKISSLIPVEKSSFDSFGTTVYPIENSSLNLLSDFGKQQLFYSIYNNQLVVSTASGIKNLTYEWQKNLNKKTKSTYSIFSDKFLAQKARKSWFSNTKQFSKSITNDFLPAYHKTIKNIEKQISNSFLVGYQTNQLNKNHHHEAIIIKPTDQNKGETGELWNLTLKHKIISPLQLLKNHRSNSLDIFVQDSTYQIHLINAVGNIKWTKQLESEIIGEVQQIDIYGNGKYQALFNTENNIHLVDINGNNVKGFPIKLSKKATNSVSVFDYNQNNNYRFWIACEDKVVYNYDKDGKAVKGWKTTKSKAIIHQKFKRTIFSGKDYIFTFDKLGNALFLNRKGESIHNLSSPLLAKNRRIQLQKRASFGSSSFIYQEDSSLSVVEFSLENTKQILTLNEKNKEIEFEILDLDQNKFIDYLGIYQNKIELYGMDKTLVNKKEFLFSLSNNYKIIKTITGKTFIALQPENSLELIILDSNLEKSHNKDLIGSLNTTIGDINKDGKSNVVTIINSATIKVVDLN